MKTHTCDHGYVIYSTPLTRAVSGCSAAGTVNVIVQRTGDQGTGQVLFIQVQGMDIESLLIKRNVFVAYEK